MPTLQNDLNTDPAYLNIIGKILRNRGIENIDEFLHPPPVDEQFFTRLRSLFGGELERATAVIRQTINDGQPIVVHGDYDVDGVSATAILWETIYYGLGCEKVRPFIPHRVEHGYGLSVESIDSIILNFQSFDNLKTSFSTLKSKAARPLLITVDCGITSRDAVEYAKSKGIEVIVTDHHTKPDEEKDQPNAAAILHTYELCGAGIAWVLARALVEATLDLEGLGESAQKQLPELTGLDLVALATLADVQPVVGLNRSLIIGGLQRLTQTDRFGLQALYDLADIRGKPIGPYEVGWVIGPRINATGRIEHALDALRLLVARNQRQAVEIAQKLEELNRQRQGMTKTAVQQAIETVERDWNKNSPIIVSHPDWHEGIIGLIAGKLVEKFNAPAIAISENEHIAKGSARSVNGIDIVEFLREYKDLMEGVGGHAMAAGFSIKRERLFELKESISRIRLDDRWDRSGLERVKVDLDLPFDLVSYDLYQALRQLEPHGVGNPRPVLRTRNLVVVDFRTVGKTGDHLKLRLRNSDGSGGPISAIGFGLGNLVRQLSLGVSVDVIYSLDKDDYAGAGKVQLKVKEIRCSE